MVHLAVFKGDGVAGMGFAADSVKTEQFAGHLEPGDLVAAVFNQYVGLEKTAADRVDRVKGLAGAVQVLATFQALAARNQFVYPGQLEIVETKRQAQFTKIAV